MPGLHINIGIGVNRNRTSSRQYWTTRYISALSVLTTSDTEQTITATIVGTGFDGVSYEYSTDGFNYTVKGTSVNCVYNAIGLTEGTLYFWRARLYKGIHFGIYSDFASGLTETVGEKIIRAGNTVAWYDSKDLTTITKNGSQEVSLWKDKLLSGKDLAQGVATKYPIWSENGILFDGINDYLKTGNFALNQPNTIYLVVKQVSWTAFNYLVDGNNASVIAQLGSSPQIKGYSGTVGGANGNLALGKYGVVTAVFNGVDSSLQIDRTVAVTGNFGSNNISTFQIGAEIASGNGCNIEVKECILRSGADSQENQDAIYAYLRDHNLTNEVWLLAGQSNAANVGGLLSELPSFYLGQNKNSLIYNVVNETFDISNTANGTHTYPISATNFGINLPLAKLRSSSQKRIFQIQKGYGGTTILAGAGNDWNVSSAGEYYDQLKVIIQKAKVYFANIGITPVWKGFIWYQGETEAASDVAAQFITQTELFLSLIRTEIGVSIPIYIGKISTLNGIYSNNIRVAQATIASDLTNCKLIDTDSMTYDGVHLNTNGKILFAQSVIANLI